MKKFFWGFIILALIGIVILGYQHYRNNRTNKFVDQLIYKISNGNIQDISANEEEKIVHILSETSTASQERIDKFREGFIDQLDQALEQEDFFSKKHLAQYQKYLWFLEKNPVLDPDQTGTDYKQVLDSRIDLIEWWKKAEEAIDMKNQVKERLQLINRMLDGNDTFLEEEEYYFYPRKYLAVKSALSILELKENKLTREIMENLSPKMKSFHDTFIPYKITYRQFQEFGNSRSDYKNLYDTLKAGMENLQDKVNDHNYLMEAILEKIFRDLPVTGKRKISNSILEQIKRMYIFDITRKQRIQGFQSLVEATFEKLNIEKAWYDRNIIKLFDEPIYIRELEILSALFSMRYYQYEAIGAVKQILNYMSNNAYSISSSIMDNLEQKHEELLVPNKPYLRETRRFFSNQLYNIRWVKRLITRWNEAYDDTKRVTDIRSGIKNRIIRHLNDLCKSTKKPGEGDCTYDYD